MKRAIVTGATGFVGRWLVRELLNQKIFVTAVICPNSCKRIFLPDTDMIRVIECGMDEYSLLATYFEEEKECVFFHLAWSGVFGVERRNLEIQFKNIYASKEAVKAASLIGCKSFIGIGSIMEEEAVAVVKTSGSKPGENYIYGEAKHFAHLVAKAVAAENNIDFLWPILTNVYGEYDSSSRFINSTLHKIIRREQLVFTLGDQIYDFIHVEDVVKALIAVGRKGTAFQRYLIGSGHAAPLRTFVEMIGNFLAPEQTLYFGDIPYTGTSLTEDDFKIDALVRDTGFIPQISFESGIERTMNWIKKYDERFYIQY